MPTEHIHYSGVYINNNFEYRHVILPPEMAHRVPTTHLLTETEWRNLGVQQSSGWVHYIINIQEPRILFFRRPRTDFS